MAPSEEIVRAIEENEGIGEDATPPKYLRLLPDLFELVKPHEVYVLAGRAWSVSGGGLDSDLDGEEIKTNYFLVTDQATYLPGTAAGADSVRRVPHGELASARYRESQSGFLILDAIGASGEVAVSITFHPSLGRASLEEVEQAQVVAQAYGLDGPPFASSRERRAAGDQSPLPREQKHEVQPLDPQHVEGVRQQNEGVIKTFARDSEWIEVRNQLAGALEPMELILVGGMGEVWVRGASNTSGQCPYFVSNRAVYVGHEIKKGIFGRKCGLLVIPASDVDEVQKQWISDDRRKVLFFDGASATAIAFVTCNWILSMQFNAQDDEYPTRERHPEEQIENVMQALAMAKRAVST